jgi:hypothetical protein
LATPRGHATIWDFFRQWIEVDRLDDFTKTTPGFAEAREHMKTEARLFTESIFSGGRPWTELFLGPTTFINEPLAAIYGQPGIMGLDFQAVTVDAKLRSGLLTQAAFLSNSPGDFGSPTVRGLFVRQRLLCMQVPPPPPGVPELIPPSPGGTRRQRYEEGTSTPVCRSCHVLMDPIGFGFEHFDGAGRYLETDNSLPIDATGQITSVEADLLGPFDGAVELLRKLAASRDVRACMAKQWFRFALSRAETEADACSIQAAIATLERGGTLTDLVVALAMSDAFHYARW